MILKAINFASLKHEGQTRKVTGKPYISHPIMVSYILAKYKDSDNLEDLIVASILHDTLEDTDTTFDEIQKEFTPLVASLVLELTNDEEKIKKLGKLTYHKNKLVGISSWALVIKLADRLSNIMDNPSEKMITDSIELMEHIISHRQNLSNTHLKMCSDIIIECIKLLKKD